MKEHNNKKQVSFFLHLITFEFWSTSKNKSFNYLMFCTLTICYTACRDHSWYMGSKWPGAKLLCLRPRIIKLYQNIFKETYYWSLRKKWSLDKEVLIDLWFFANILILLVKYDSTIKKFNFQKVNHNIFEGAWGSYPLQKIENLLFLNQVNI